MRIFPKLKEREVHLPVRLWFVGLTIYPFIFLTKTHSVGTIEHERIHIRQQDKWWAWAGPLGLLLWFSLYLIVFPIGWNPFRWKWEYEAYSEANGYVDEKIREKMKKSPYFLWWH